jgi:hypothetical protein
MSKLRNHFLQVLILFFFSIPFFAFAATSGYISTTLGTPPPPSNPTRDAPFNDTYYGNGHVYSRLCGNLACTVFTRINWLPSSILSTPGRVVVSDSGLSGYIWSEKFGWINLDPNPDDDPDLYPLPGSGCTHTGVKMIPEGSGILTGCAWGQGTGWINFNVSDVDDIEIGVQINNSKEFTGWAWVQNSGWMYFGCEHAFSCVKTTWGAADTPADVDGGGSPGPIPLPTPDPGPSPDPIPLPLPTPGPGPGPLPLPLPTPTPGPGPGPGPIPIPDPAPLPIDDPGFIRLKKIIESEEGKAIIRTIGAIGLISGLIASLGGLFLSPTSFSDFLLIPTRLWSLLLGAVGLAKRRRPWGTVYDSVTKQPLDPAYVVLRSIEGKDVATAITDLDGRFGFVVPEPGAYTLIAHKTNYSFPSQKLVGYDHDELYRDLYFGETFSIASAGEVITRNIPMDPEHFDWNEFAKKKRHLMRFYSSRETWLLRLSNFFFYFGFAVAAVTVVISMTKYNIIVFGLYVLLFIIRKVGLRARPFGSITSSVSGDPIPFAIIRITQATTGVEVMHRVTDMLGRYYALLPNGDYTIRVDQKLADASYKTVASAIAVKVTKGYLSEKLTVDTGPEDSEGNSILPPPPSTAVLSTNTTIGEFHLELPAPKPVPKKLPLWARVSRAIIAYIMS